LREGRTERSRESKPNNKGDSQKHPKRWDLEKNYDRKREAENLLIRQLEGQRAKQERELKPIRGEKE